MLTTINPVTYPGWDDLIKTHGRSGVFHTSAWAKVLNQSYGYTPYYLAKIQNGSIVQLLPILELSNKITGRRAVSLPFTDYCEPLLEGNSILDALKHVIPIAKKQGWKCIDFKVPLTTLGPETSYSSSYRHILDTNRSIEDIHGGMASSHRRNVKKALKSNVEIVISNSHNSMLEFYNLHVQTRRKHGLPPQPVDFFNNIYHQIIDQGLGFIVKAIYEDRTIAANVNFHFNGRAIYKYGASDHRYLNFRPNNLCMWKTIEYCQENGYKELCFGRTEFDNQGLRDFKLRWGTREEIIADTRYYVKTQQFKALHPKTSGFHTKVFRNMPESLLKLVGNMLYKYMG